MIVLAIGAMILLAVLLAVSHLQRNGRNDTRRDQVLRVKSELENFTNENRGNPPQTAAEIAAFETEFNNLGLKDPSLGTPVTLGYNTCPPGGCTSTLRGISLDEITFYSNAACTRGEAGSNFVTLHKRNYALIRLLEGGASFCVDNR